MSDKIKFTRQHDGDYTALVWPWRLTIWKSTDAGFGVSAHFIAEGERPKVPREFWGIHNSIAWCRSKKRCEEYAASFLEAMRAEMEKA